MAPAHPVLHVVPEVPLVVVALPVNHRALPFDLVVDPVPLVITALATTVEDLALAMLEAILEVACVDVAASGYQHALALHLSLPEAALEEVSVRESLATYAVVLTRVHLEARVAVLVLSGHCFRARINL